MIYELNHVGMIVGDLDRTLELYLGVLEGEVVFRRARLDGSAEIVYVQVGRAMLECIAGLAQPAALGAPGLHHLGYMSTSIHQDYEKLLAGGAEEWFPPGRAGTGVGYTALARGEAGVTVELIERDPEFRRDEVVGLVRSVEWHAAATTRDHAVAFYVETMGMSLVRDDVYAMGPDLLRLHMEGPGAREASPRAIVLAVADVASVADRLEAAAFAFRAADGELELADPDGTTIRIVAEKGNPA